MLSFSVLGSLFQPFHYLCAEMGYWFWWSCLQEFATKSSWYPGTIFPFYPPPSFFFVFWMWVAGYYELFCLYQRISDTEHKQVRNETAEDFLDLLKAWENLCKKYINGDRDVSVKRRKENSRKNNSNKNKSSSSSDGEEYEVWKLVDICYGDPNNHGNRGLHFKVLITSHLDTS